MFQFATDPPAALLSRMLGIHIITVAWPSPLSRYNKKDPYRPERSTPITSLAITINDPRPKDTTHQAKSLTTALGP